MHGAAPGPPSPGSLLPPTSRRGSGRSNTRCRRSSKCSRHSSRCSRHSSRCSRRSSSWAQGRPCHRCEHVHAALHSAFDGSAAVRCSAQRCFCQLTSIVDNVSKTPPAHLPLQLALFGTASTTPASSLYPKQLSVSVEGSLESYCILSHSQRCCTPLFVAFVAFFIARQCSCVLIACCRACTLSPAAWLACPSSIPCGSSRKDPAGLHYMPHMIFPPLQFVPMLAQPT